MIIDRLFFFGSPLVDVTANVDVDFLREHNLKADNAYVIDDVTRTIFGQLKGGKIEVGGSVTNTVRVANEILKLPERIFYFGTVGNDDFGEFILEKLEKEELGRCLSVAEGSTGKVAVLLNGKNRTLITDLGISKTFTIQEKVWTEIKKNNCLIYFSAFFISVSFQIIENILQTSENIAFNLGAPFLSLKFSNEMKKIYKKSFLIFGNETEHRAFAKTLNITSNDLMEIVSATNKNLPLASRVVIVTRGGGSVLVVAQSDWSEFKVDPVAGEALDTNGAGDAFVGGFLARYVCGHTISNCIKFAIETARCRIMHNSCE